MRFKQDRMSTEERMDALFNYRKPDRIPINMITVGFPCRNVGQTVATGYDNPEKYFQAMIWTAEQYGWDLIPEICPHVVLGAVDFGGEFRLPEGEFEGALVITSFPVKTKGDIDNLKVPDPKKSGKIGKAMELSKLQVVSSCQQAANYLPYHPRSIFLPWPRRSMISDGTGNSLGGKEDVPPSTRLL